MADNDRSLERAILQDDIILAATLLNEGHHPSPDDFKCAVERKSISILDLFLQDGYDINQAIRSDRPPVLADALSDRDLTEWLLQKGADPNARCYCDVTPLSIAAGSAPLEVIRLLFMYGASTEHGAPLHCAVQAERSNEILEFLIGKGAAVNELLFEKDVVSHNHYVEFYPLGTPLHEAAVKQNERIFDLLLSNGADRTIKDNFGVVPAIADKSKL